MFDMKKPGSLFVIFLQVPVGGRPSSPPPLSCRTHLLHCAGGSWWGEGWNRTHTFQPHSTAWGCHSFLWCDSALCRGCSHLNKCNINAIIRKQCFDTKMPTGTRFLLAFVFFFLAHKGNRFISNCVRLDRLGLGIVLRTGICIWTLKSVPWCFFHNHKMGVISHMLCVAFPALRI